MRRILKGASWGLDRIIDGSGALGIVIMVALSIFVCIVMLSRHVLALNVPAFFDAAVYSMIIFPFATAAYAMRAGKHITIDVLFNRLSKKGQVTASIITNLVSLIFVFVLLWQTRIWFSSLYDRGTSTVGVWQIPAWILVGIILAGSILLFLQIIKIVSKDLHFLVTDKSSGAISFRDYLMIAGFIIGFVGAIYLYMEGNNIAATMLLLMVVLLSGMPVFLGLGLIAMVGLYFAVGAQGIVQIPLTIYGSLNSFTLSCLPLFIFSGLIMAKGKLVDDLFRFVEAWIGNFTPSLLLVTIVAAMILSSLTGSSTAVTAMLSATAIPILAKRGFKTSQSCGAIAASGCGSLIPPSVGYIIYCLLVEESIGEMFIAAMMPAIMLFAMFVVYIILVNVFNKKSFFEGGQIPPRSSEWISWEQRFALTRKALPILFGPVLVLGSIYLGIFTPTEAAAALLLYSIILTVFIKRTLNWRGVYKACAEGTLTSALVLCLMATAFIFATVVSQLRVNEAILAFAQDVRLGPAGVIGMIFVTLLILGMLMSGPPIKVITLPIFYPIALAVGINPIWLGVFYQIISEFSTFTPPFGMDFFVMKAVAGVPYGEVLRGIIPYIFLFILALVLITVFPEIVLWLPSTMR